MLLIIIHLDTGSGTTNKLLPEPMLTKVHDAIWRHLATLTENVYGKRKNTSLCIEFKFIISLTRTKAVVFHT